MRGVTCGVLLLMIGSLARHALQVSRFTGCQKMPKDTHEAKRTHLVIANQLEPEHITSLVEPNS